MTSTTFLHGYAPVAFRQNFDAASYKTCSPLSGRNFETKQYEETIAEQSFSAEAGCVEFHEPNSLRAIRDDLRSAGFVSSRLIGGQNAVNFAYIIYLRGRAESSAAEVEACSEMVCDEHAYRPLFRNPETAFDLILANRSPRARDLYQRRGYRTVVGEFWSTLLPQQMDVIKQQPLFQCFKHQVKLNDKGFLRAISPFSTLS